MMIVVSVILVICLHSLTSASGEAIPPVSTAVMLGEEAKFNCSGEALTAFWTINNITIVSYGIESTQQIVDGVLTSTLAVIGSAQYDNASIQCSLVVSPTTILPLPPAVLTVLGIGQVPSIKLVNPVNNFPLFIRWEKPMFISSDVTDLTYNVSVSNVFVSGADPSPMNVTTNETECCQDMLFACQVYNITVTPFSTSSSYVGASNGTEDSIDEVDPYLDGECKTKNRFVNANDVTVLFICPVIRLPNACLDQDMYLIKILVGSYSDDSSEPLLINSSMDYINDSIMKHVSGLPANEKCYSNFTLTDMSGLAVSTVVTNFTTYSVQNATFEIFNSHVNVTCIFAINASASACQIVFTNASFGLNFTGIVNHSLPESTGLIDIPRTILLDEELQRLGSVVFDAKVFDVYMDGTVTDDIAYELQEALVVQSVTLSTDILGSTTVSFTMAIPSTSPVEKGLQVVAVIGVGIGIASVGIIVPSLLVTLSVICYFCKRKIRKKNLEDFVEDYVHYASQTAPESKIVPEKSNIQESNSIPESDSSQGDLDASMKSPLTTTTTDNTTTTTDNTTTTDVTTGSVDNGTKLCSPAYEDVTVKRPQPSPTNGESHYADLAPRPLDAPMVLPELDRVEYMQIKKHTVDYAELGARPADAPLVLPPDTCVHYVDVKPTPKAKNCIPGAAASFGLETTVSADTKSSSISVTAEADEPPKLPEKRTGLAKKKATSSWESTSSPRQSIPPKLPEKCTSLASSKKATSSWESTESPQQSFSSPSVVADGSDTHEEWEGEPEEEAAFNDKVVPEFGQHLAIVNVGGEPSHVRSCTAGQSLSEMVLATDYVRVTRVSLNYDAKNESPCVVLPTGSIPSFASKSKEVGGNCFEVDENAEPCLTMSENQVQESGGERSGELNMVEGDHYQEETSSVKPLQKESKMTQELTEEIVRSNQRNQQSLSFTCPLGNQSPCIPSCDLSSIFWYRP